MPARAMSYQPQQWRPPAKPYQPLGPAHVPDGADEAAGLAADRSERQDAWIRDQNCHRCGGKGHFQRECPTKKRDQVATEQTEGNRNRYRGRGGYHNWRSGRGGREQNQSAPPPPDPPTPPLPPPPEPAGSSPPAPGSANACKKVGKRRKKHNRTERGGRGAPRDPLVIVNVTTNRPEQYGPTDAPDTGGPQWLNVEDGDVEVQVEVPPEYEMHEVPP